MIYYVDLDGTVFDGSHRAHFLNQQNVENSARWASFFNPALVAKDALIPGAEMLNRILASDNPVIFLTGRPERLREASVEALSKYYKNFNPEKHLLVMRPNMNFQSAADWKVGQLADRKDLSFTLIDDDDQTRQAVIERFPRATVLSPVEGWDYLMSVLGFTTEDPAEEITVVSAEPSGDESTSDSDTSAEVYSDMDL